MSGHFSMGAINKTTNNYEYPKIANKINKYKCPFCEKDVIFRNGKIKQPHFAHYKSDNPCSYYEKPNETQIHKDAKLLMKTLLDNKKSICIERNCNYCEQYKYHDSGLVENNCYVVFGDDYENSESIIEYKFYYNNSNRSADVVLLKNDKINYIFEICYKNKTKEENRPEPWFEINAENLINQINSGEIIDNDGNVSVECIRDYKCYKCVNYEMQERKRQLEIVEILKNKEREQQLEKNELMNMSKEDYRTIELKYKRESEIEKERIKRDNEYKEREQQRKKAEENQRLRIEKDKKELEERQRKIYEYNDTILQMNKRCNICHINYCKCTTFTFMKDEYNIKRCLCCNKQQCKCIRITNYFQKNKN